MSLFLSANGHAHSQVCGQARLARLQQPATPVPRMFRAQLVECRLHVLIGVAGREGEVSADGLAGEALGYQPQRLLLALCEQACCGRRGLGSMLGCGSTF